MRVWVKVFFPIFKGKYNKLWWLYYQETQDEHKISCSSKSFIILSSVAVETLLNTFIQYAFLVVICSVLVFLLTGLHFY